MLSSVGCPALLGTASLADTQMSTQAIPSQVAGSASKTVALTGETGRAVERQEIALGVQVKGWSLLSASGW